MDLPHSPQTPQPVDGIGDLLVLEGAGQIKTVGRSNQPLPIRSRSHRLYPAAAPAHHE